MIAWFYAPTLLAWVLFSVAADPGRVPPELFVAVMALHLSCGVWFRWSVSSKTPKLLLSLLPHALLLGLPGVAPLWFSQSVAGALRRAARNCDEESEVFQHLWSASQMWRRMGFAAVVGGVLWVFAYLEVLESGRLSRTAGLYLWSDPLGRLPFFFSSIGTAVRFALVPLTVIHLLLLLRSRRLLRVYFAESMASSSPAI